MLPRRTVDLQPGTPVRYHGSRAAEHGIYTVGPGCPCDDCWAAAIDFGVYAEVRRVLLRNGKPALEHIDERSLTRCWAG